MIAPPFPYRSRLVELYEAMRTTPATREFAPAAVPDAQLHRILDHARFAPSGGNRQPWRVIVVRDPAARRQLRDLARLGWREYAAQLERGLVPFAPGDGRRWTGPALDLAAARAQERPNRFFDQLDRAPALLVLCADLRQLACLDAELDRMQLVGGGSIYPFAQNLLLAARNEGLGGVLTTLVVRQEPAVRELLGIPREFAVAALIALGRPARRVTRLRRKPVEEFTTLDRFDGEPLRGAP
jgi:nitroreductase